MKQLTLLVAVLSVFTATQAQAKLDVLTTTTDLAAVAREVGGGEASVSSIAKGTQDPHYIEAKPSYMIKASRADLVISVGLELEIGYLPPILQGARNPKVMPAGRGYLEVGQFIQPLELPSGHVTRAEGDVHPQGNPHFMLDPIRAGQVAVGIAQRMAELDPDHAAGYTSRAKAFQTRMETKTKGWQDRVAKSGVKKAVSYHKTLTYFFDRFHIENPAILEPKPGIPPTAAHTLDVISIIKQQNIPLVMIENYFDPTVANRIKESVPSIRIAVVPVAVEGDSGISTLDDLYEKLVSTVEGK